MTRRFPRTEALIPDELLAKLTDKWPHQRGAGRLRSVPGREAVHARRGGDMAADRSLSRRL